MAMQSDPTTTSSAAEAEQVRERQSAERLSESEYLTQQANAAREAMQRTAQELLEKLKTDVDPRQLAKEHPWISLAVAAAGGFTAAVVAVPSKEQQALKRLAEMERAVGMHQNGKSKKHHEPDDDTENAGAKHYAKGHGSFWQGLAMQVLEAVKPAILSALTAGITAKAAKTEPEDVAAATNNPAPGTPNNNM